ncbi:unnamed protein product [Schistosoma curassoni]|uniref:Ovule protein n=1 Tax=Schistosoma curassoni TaxID=6186 RepID=A0A183L661_9TREM|nr:unnamed protein product [Schistosoma curassoni]
MNCNPNDVNMCLARIHLLGESDIKQQCYNKLLAVSRILFIHTYTDTLVIYLTSFAFSPRFMRLIFE